MNGDILQAEWGCLRLLVPKDATSKAPKVKPASISYCDGSASSPSAFKTYRIASNYQSNPFSIKTMSATGLPIQPTPPAPSPQQVDEARTAFTASLLSAGTSTVQSDLQARASDIHANAAAIDKQEQELLKETMNLGRESKKWQKVVDDGAKGVKETGDVQNWAEMLERDLCVLEDTMAMAEEGGTTASANGHSR
ncbi:MAG: hypothetical protein Q9213_001096 [Squamulea squamosa]